MEESKALLDIAGCKVTATALVLPPGMREEQWMTVASKVTHVGTGFWWWIGALANHASHHFDQPDQYIQQLAEATGAGVKYIKIIAFCENRYAVKDRIKGLSITHHMHAMYLPQAKRQEILKRAFTENWPVRVLDQHLSPPEKRFVTVVMRVPTRVQRRPEFVKALREFCATWECRTAVYGSKYPRVHSGKKAGIKALLG